MTQSSALIRQVGLMKEQWMGLMGLMKEALTAMEKCQSAVVNFYVYYCKQLAARPGFIYLVELLLK